MKEAKIKLTDLRLSSNRTYGGEGEIKILAEDIKRNGLINPITVKACGQKEEVYEVIAGRRRLMAVKLLDWKEIPCRILEGNETERAAEIAGSENINRLAMHPLDEAAIFAKMIENGQAIEELAKRYDRKASAIWQRVQLLDLNEDIKTLFRNGHLTLQSAAMVKSLNADIQKEFYKHFKNHRAIKDGAVIEDHQVIFFISRLDHDRLHGFLRDKQCAECKTRTYFTDKNLFPEMDDVSENCFNHDCYLRKWEKVLAVRIKSLKGKHKTHSGACLIVSRDDDFQKVVGKKTTIDGIDYKILPNNYMNHATAKEKGAHSCFSVDISHSGKLVITCDYWKEAEKTSFNSGISVAEKRRRLNPVVDILDLPKAEKDEVLDAMSNSKRISPSSLSNNVRDSVFWRLMDIKAREFNDPKNVNPEYKEMFLKKYFHYLGGSDKKIFEKYAGKMTIPELAKLASDKIYALLLAMEWNTYDLPGPESLAKGKQQNEILKWIGLAPDKLKEIYQDEFRKRIPKQKPEEKKPADKKRKPLPSPEQMNKNYAKNEKAKKFIPNHIVTPPVKKPHTGLAQGKGKGKKK